MAEEYQEEFSVARVAAIAAEMRAADDHDHVIAVHQLSGVDFDFADDPVIDQFAIQYNQGTAGALHDGMVEAWDLAQGRYNLNMSEAAGYGTGTEARLKSWATAMGGAYVMQLGMDIASTDLADLEDCGRMRAFFEATDFPATAPHDELALGDADFVLADPGSSYLAYADDAAAEMGVRDLPAGDWTFAFFEIATGTWSEHDEQA